MFFFDEQGELLKTNTLAVLPGRSVSLDLVADEELRLGLSERRQIRAVLATLRTVEPSQTGLACVLAPTFEILISPRAGRQS